MSGAPRVSGSSYATEVSSDWSVAVPGSSGPSRSGAMQQMSHVDQAGKACHAGRCPDQVNAPETTMGWSRKPRPPHRGKLRKSALLRVTTGRRARLTGLLAGLAELALLRRERRLLPGGRTERTR